MDKFNSFAKAQGEVEPVKKTIDTIRSIPKQTKERKEQVSIMLTPTDKEKARRAAEEANMSVSELISYLINNSI